MTDQDSVPTGGFDCRFAVADLLIVRGLDIEHLGVQIDEERASRKLFLRQHLAERIAIDEDLLAAADQPVIVVIRMRVVLGPGDESVRPRRAVHPLRAGDRRPVGEMVGPREDDCLALGGPQGDGAVRLAVLVDHHLLAIDAPMHEYSIAGLCTRHGVMDRAGLAVGVDPGQRSGPTCHVLAWA